jgi:hypothetical protein
MVTRKFFIFSIIGLFFGLLSMNLLFAESTISVSPTPLNIGETLTINIIPDIYGINNYVYIYNPYNQQKAYIVLNCTNYKCFTPQTISYAIPATFFNGMYYASVYSYAPVNTTGNGTGNVSQSINAYFEVTGSSVPAVLSTISASPNQVASNSPLTINVIPGSNGAYRYIYIYNSQNYYLTSIDSACNTSSYCYNPFSKTFTIPTNWFNGDYVAKVYDALSGQYISAPFTVYGSNATTTTATLTPTDVSPGQTLKISITPGSNGISRYVYVYDFRNKQKQTITFSCPTGKCLSPLNYNLVIPGTWLNGLYSVQLYDYGSSAYKIYNFNVINSTAVLTNAQMSLSPAYLARNQTLKVNVIPGTDGTSSSVYFYNYQNSYKGYLYLACVAPCKSPVAKNYTIPATFAAGNYTARLYDYTSNSDIISPFYVY